MCIVKFANNDYSDMGSLYRELIYVTDPEKCLHKCIGTQDLMGTDIDYICNQFQMVKLVHNKTSGKQFHHLIVSLKYMDTWEYSDVFRFANHFISYLPEGHQVLYAVHEEKYYLHIHYIINSVNWYSGNRLNVDLDMISWINVNANYQEQLMNQRIQEEMNQVRRAEERAERARDKEMLKLINKRC